MKRQRVRERDQADALEQAESRAEGLVARLKALQAAAAPQSVDTGPASPGEAAESVDTEGEAEGPGLAADEDEPGASPDMSRTLPTGGDPMGDKVPKRPPKPKKPKKPKA